MRRSIKLISLAITIALFIILDIFWEILTGSLESGQLWYNTILYYVILIIIIGSMAVLVLYYFFQTRQKSKIKL